jgi:hypothetical protein
MSTSFDLVGKRKQNEITRSERRCDSGFLVFKEPMLATLLFERFPIWILILESKSCAKVYLPQFKSLQEFTEAALRFGSDLFLQRLIHRLGVSRFVFEKSGPLGGICLVSGSLKFLVGLLASQNPHWLGVVDHHFHGRLRNGRPTGYHVLSDTPVYWHRVRHETVGGVTEYHALKTYYQMSLPNEGRSGTCWTLGAVRVSRWDVLLVVVLRLSTHSLSL